jgi:hypothetical protein
MKADYVEACNCDFGCPCNFTGFPTYGYCRTLIFFHINSGNFGNNVKLDGLEVIVAISWRGLFMKEMELFNYSLQKNTDEKQRQALVSIFSGQAKEDGPFALFAPTYKYILDPQFVDIVAKIDGKVVSQSQE